MSKGADDTVHNLFIKIVAPGDTTDEKSRELTKQVLRYLAERVGHLREMGLKLQVNRVRASDLANPRLRQAMKDRGIKSLPALTTPNNCYLGVKEIASVYDTNIKEYQAYLRREEKTAHKMPDAPESTVEDFYRREMNMDAHDRDRDISDDKAIGEEGADRMMSRYNQVMSRRVRTTGSPPKTHRSGAVDDDGPEPLAPRRGPPAARSAGAARPDNLQGGDDDDPETAALIGTINRELQPGDARRAFTTAGGDSLSGDGDEGGGDAADRLMLSKWVENQEDSLH